jgi:hypothetical protein
MTSTVSLFQVDALTRKPFGGNPAVICLLAQTQDKDRGQVSVRPGEGALSSGWKSHSGNR